MEQRYLGACREPTFLQENTDSGQPQCEQRSHIEKFTGKGEQGKGRERKEGGIGMGKGKERREGGGNERKGGERREGEK